MFCSYRERKSVDSMAYRGATRGAFRGGRGIGRGTGITDKVAPSDNLVATLYPSRELPQTSSMTPSQRGIADKHKESESMYYKSPWRTIVDSMGHFGDSTSKEEHIVQQLLQEASTFLEKTKGASRRQRKRARKDAEENLKAAIKVEKDVQGPTKVQKAPGEDSELSGEEEASEVDSDCGECFDDDDDVNDDMGGEGYEDYF